MDLSEREQVRQKCVLCPKTFTKWHSLKAHLAENHFKNKFLTLSGSSLTKCGICGKGFNSPKSLGATSGISYHLAFTHGLLEQLIPDDLKALRSGQKLQPTKGLLKIKEEMKQAKRDITPTELKCPVCGYFLKTLRGLQYHIVQSHLKEEFLNESGSSETMCGICDQQFANDGVGLSMDTSIAWHVASTHDLLGQYIPGDGSSTSSGHTMQLTQDEHKLKSMRRQCFLCPNDYKTLRGLRHHLAYHHFRDKLLTYSGSTEDMCNICDKSFKTGRQQSSMNATITWHLAFTHDLLKQWVPDQLDILSLPHKRPQSPKQSLEIENKICQSNLENNTCKVPHGSSQSKSCFLCPNKFKDLRYLKHHLAKTHFGQELLNKSESSSTKCGICNKVFSADEDDSNLYKTITWHLAFMHGLIGQLLPQDWTKSIWLEKINLVTESLAEEKKKKKKQETRKNNGSKKKETRKNNGSKKKEPMVHSKKRKPCFLCSSDYKSLRGLRRHLARDHFGEKLLQESLSSRDECGICSKQFKHEDGALASITWHLAFTHDLLRKWIPQEFEADIMSRSQQEIEKEKDSAQNLALEQEGQEG